MKHEISVGLIPPRADMPQAVLFLVYENVSLNLRLSGPEALARWIAYLFARRDLNPFLEPEETTMIPVGHCGRNCVSFAVTPSAMAFLVCEDKSGDDFIEQGFTIELPIELLDDLADGLAREHRRWIEPPVTTPGYGQ